jgi:hypothetical protein
MEDSPYLVQRADLDQVKAFTAYCLTGGHIGRTAILCRCSNSTIESLAHDFNWPAKVGTVVRMDTDEGLAEQKALNRVSNFMVAERLKQVIVGVIDRLHDDPDRAAQLCIEIKNIPGTKETEVSFNPKALTELAKGLETATNITYRALGDKQAQEADVSGPKNRSNADLAMEVYKALSNRWDRSALPVHAVEIAKAVNVG